ncbi:MAG: hypothetical protein E7294_12425 [Lachnospiraceae bacterium]|nr:hypothetical protein [Lachnospiraceae bacterium]
MNAFSKGIVKCRFIILIISVVLLIPSAIGYFGTRINYDVLTYLPKDIETMVGQDILVDEFGTGAFSMIVTEGLPYKDIAKLKENIAKVDHVKKVLWYDSVADISTPRELLPENLREVFDNEEKDASMMAVLFDTTISADETMDAIEEIRRVTKGQCFVSGMSAIVTDTKNLSNQETPIYVLIAVVLSAIVLSVTMDSYVIPLFFLLSIGMAIVYNLGSCIFMGEISYITKALAAVLQLGVTMDYSIFLWHSYEEEKQSCPDKNEAMANAITATFTSVIGSSITTIAGFIALCFMSFTLGLDLGIVMAKGVFIGVIACVTILPSMILVFDKVIEKTRHKPLIPEFKISKFVAKHYIIIAVLFVIIWIPAIFGYKRTQVYYNLDSTLPKTLESVIANEKLEEDFNMNTTHIVLIDSSISSKVVSEMIHEIKDVDGVKSVIGLDAFVGPMLPREMLPDKLKDSLMDENYQMMLVTSEYKVASKEVNAQCDALKEVIKKYDDKGMLIGEAPCTEDLITVTDKDFKTVSAVSIGVIFIIILFVFRSVSLPVILVGVIEFAIYINMGLPYYTNVTIPFIASIVIGTIQLGSTVDYAILMTNRYKVERKSGLDKMTAVINAHQASVQSIFVSAASFFAATFGVGLYSDIDVISSLCNLMARGAVISMFTVMLVLPSMLIIFDGLIRHTSIGFKNKNNRKEEKYYEKERDIKYAP